MHHKRKLSFKNFENNIEGNIWSLFWYGKIYFKSKDSRFYIETYLVLLKNENYFLNNIDKKRVEKIEIPFSKSILFPLSSQFDYQGKFIRMSNLYDGKGGLLRNGLYKIGKLKISNDYNFRIKGLDYIFSNSLFPDVYENGISIYQDSSYFIRKIESDKKKEEQDDEKTYQYIIPIDVVLKYFFGFSSLIFDLLITDRLKYAIFDKSIDPVTRKGKLYYDSNLIPKADASLIAKYYFTKNSYAEKIIRDIGAHFSKLRFNKTKDGSFIKFKIPFDFPCDFIFVGQYLTKNNTDSQIRKIIVNQILEISADENYFLVEDNIDLIDVNSSQNDNDDKNESEAKDVRNTNDVNPTKDKETDDLPLDKNNNDKIVENLVVLRNYFMESPILNHLLISKDKDGNPIYLNDERPIDHSDFPYYEGTNRRKTLNYKDIKWIEIIDDALEYLVNTEQYIKERLSDKVSERLTNKVIFNLIYNDVNYYTLDSGGNNYFPLFRNKNKNESIDIDDINEIIQIIKNDYKSRWAVVSNKKSLKDIKEFSSLSFLKENDVLFLRNNTHELIEKEGKDTRTTTIENLAKKIHKKILKDLKESSVK